MADGSGRRTHAGGGRWSTGSRRRGTTYRWRWGRDGRAAGGAGVRAGGETVLDLGCLGPAGFRGWSGGARSWFAITAAEATPGYLPGELEAGMWQVMIGLYRVPPDGVPYRVTAQASGHGAGLVPAAPRRRRRRGSGRHRGTCRRSRPAVARGRPALAHRALRRRADRPRAGRPGGRARARLPRGHRPQHDQPPRRAGRRGPAVRDHAAARPGGDDRRRARRRAGRRRAGSISAANPTLAGRDAGPRRACSRSTTRSPAAQLDAPDAPPPAAGRGVALELAGQALDPSVRVVAGLGPRGDPGRRQRLAPARLGGPAGLPDHLGRVRGPRAGRRARRPAGGPGGDLGRARRPGAAAPSTAS